MDEERWRDEEWLSTARDWAVEQGASAGRPVVGEAEQTHVTRWSTVLRLPTAQGPLWFKANDVSMRHEAGLVELLAGAPPRRGAAAARLRPRPRVDADGRRR